MGISEYTNVVKSVPLVYPQGTPWSLTGYSHP